VEIEHVHGTTTIEQEPQRVVSVGFSDQDVVLDFEAVAALEPDLIVGLSSGMTASDYELLSQIAPTLAQSGDFPDFGMPWQEKTLVVGEALGRTGQAEEVVAKTEAVIEAARAEHPEFEGATAAVSFLFDGQPGAYASTDTRARLMADLGFQTPAQFEELAGDAFFFTVSPEQITTLDAEVLVWIVGSEAEAEAEAANIAELPTRSILTAAQEGREVLTDTEVSGALSFSSPLSLPYALEQLVPELALAVDGDPTTEVPSAAALAR